MLLLFISKRDEKNTRGDEDEIKDHRREKKY
jgi:hypothetical protein